MADKERTVEERIVGLAEQFGRLIGAVERKADGLFDQQALRNQVEQIRNGASELLDQLGGAIASGRAATKARTTPPRAKTAGRSGGTVDAPGKAHRKRAESVRGVKHSDQTVAKITGAKTMRRGHRRG